PGRVAFGEGEDERVLRAAQTIVDEGLARPVLIGRRAVIEAEVKRLGLRLECGRQIEILDPDVDVGVFGPLVARYQALADRRGVPPADAAHRVGARPSVAAALLLAAGHVDAALCGGAGDWWTHMTDVLPVVPRQEGVSRIYSITCLVLPTGPLFLADTHVNVDPTSQQVAEMTLLAAEVVRRFGLTPKAALLSHSSFGASNSPTARKMREALRLVRQAAPDLAADGEMHADAALKPILRQRLVTASPLEGAANLLVMPGLDAANIALTLLSSVTDALQVGPLLLGASKPLHILVPGVTARGIVNMTALAVAQGAAGR
ncbi:MAG: NADP-dependent malic enzyme, partial [Proteobacteria bacterium]|nr:NADP-dependent malic enzyme [Pseudomonadota bacterium]